MLRSTVYRPRQFVKYHAAPSLHIVTSGLSQGLIREGGSLTIASRPKRLAIHDRCTPQLRHLTTSTSRLAVDIPNAPASSFSKPLQRDTNEYLDVHAIDLTGWETIIGLEIHAQLKTKRKLFSSAETSWEAEPNTSIVPFDAAFPGTLPVLNRKAVDLTLRTALALKCSVNHRSTFDRKHYFYHDIPASYQITQHYNPIATNGYLDIDSQGQSNESSDWQPLRVRIQQIQIEQDTAKTTRLNDGSVFVDLNRAGSGLMEIVTEADMRSPAQAAAFIKKLQAILRRLNASDGDMEKGSLRVDANVSIHRVGTPFETRCEIKNLNSVKFMQQALDYERRRHVAHYLAHPGTPIRQETRGFNESLGKTHTLRTKEDAEDYRYMPDPNLPPMVIADVYLDHLATDLPELPDAARHRLATEYGVTHTDVDTLLSLDEFNGQGIQYFEDVVKGTSKTDKHLEGKKAVNWITHELLGKLAQRQENWDAKRFPAKYMRELLNMVENGDLTGSSAKTLLKHILEQDNTSGQLNISSIAKDLGLIAQGDDELEKICKAVVEKLPKEVDSIRKGKVNVVMRLVGQVMKDSKGTADARKAKDILLSLIEQRKP